MKGPVRLLIAGGTCSGKSTLAKAVAERTGWPIAGFGSVLYAHALTTGQPTTRPALQELGAGLIEELGHAGFLAWILEHKPTFPWEASWILEGVRHTLMVEELQARFPGAVLVYCACDRQTQMARLMARDGLSPEDAQRDLGHALEQDIEAISAQASLVFSERTWDVNLSQLFAAIGPYNV